MTFWILVQIAWNNVVEFHGFIVPFYYSSFGYNT